MKQFLSKTLCIFVIQILFAIAVTIAFNQYTKKPAQFDDIQIKTANNLVTFNVEIADTEPLRNAGLMNREYLEKDAGMLFMFNRPQQSALWMKNTPIPLDIIFIKDDGQISNIIYNAVPNSTEKLPSNGKVKGILEINAGVATNQNIQVGDVVIHDHFSKSLPGSL